MCATWPGHSSWAPLTGHTGTVDVGGVRAGRHTLATGGDDQTVHCGMCGTDPAPAAGPR